MILVCDIWTNFDNGGIWKGEDQDNNWVMTFYGLKVVGMIGRIRKKMAFGMLWIWVFYLWEKESFLERESMCLMNDYVGRK